jgi:hypothetical protein
MTNDDKVELLLAIGAHSAEAEAIRHARADLDRRGRAWFVRHEALEAQSRALRDEDVDLSLAIAASDCPSMAPSLESLERFDPKQAVEILASSLEGGHIGLAPRLVKLVAEAMHRHGQPC